MTDGRNARVERTKAAIMGVVREAMAKGIFRPNVPDTAAAAGVSVRSVFQHFGSVEDMHRAAADDGDTATAILNLVLGPDWSEITLPDGLPHRLLHLAVFGRLPS